MINTFYLGFDLTLLQQPKFIALKRKHGHIGIGVYFELCLKQAIYTNYKIELADIEDIAFDIRCQSEIIKDLINLNIFEKDEKYFWSSDVFEKMKSFDKIRKIKSKAGKASATSRKEKPKQDEQNSTRVQHVLNRTSTEPQQNSTRVEQYNIIQYNKNKPKEIYIDILEFSENFKKALDDWIEFRKKIKKPLTDRAIELGISKLQSLHSEEYLQIQAINQSIEHGWTTFYTVKNPQPQSRLNTADKPILEIDPETGLPPIERWDDWTNEQQDEYFTRKQNASRQLFESKIKI